MTSPIVWQDGLDRAKAAADPLGLVVRDAFAQNRETLEDAYILYEVASVLSDRLGMGETVDEETGQIWLHLMVPSGSGALAAITQRKALSVAFRMPAAPLPAGLFYDGQAYDPPDSDETGNWVRFSLMIDYRYQDIIL